MQLYGMTDIGQKRETNQDVFCTHAFFEQAGFAIVCDGMGGQNGGHIASDLTCKILSEKLMESNIVGATDDEIKQIMITAMSEANIAVYKASNIEPGCKGMGTTAELAIVNGSKVYIAHIGDSRVYLLREDGLHQVTRDHSVVQELLEQGKISEEEAKVHPNKNMITRAVGVGLTVDIDYLQLPFEQGSKLILCSDGLTNMVDDQTIEKTIRTNDAADVCAKLVLLANQAGGVDNITVAVIAH